MAHANGYKLILRYPYSGMRLDSELYDLRAYERETVNLYAKPTPEQSQAIAQMSKDIRHF